MEAGWWTPDPSGPRFGEGEEEYLIDLLMGGSAAKHPGGGEDGRTGGPTLGRGSGKQADLGRRTKKGSGREKGGKQQGSFQKGGEASCRDGSGENGCTGRARAEGVGPLEAGGQEGGKPPHSPQGPETEAKNNPELRPSEATGT